MQPLRQPEAVERPHDGAAAGDAEHGPEHRFHRKPGEDLEPGFVAADQDLHQHDGEEDRERIVGAGFDFQRGTDLRPQP